MKETSDENIKKVVKEYCDRKGLPKDIALAFEDVAVVDLFSEIPSRSMIKDTKTQLTKVVSGRGLFLKVPIVSANMDTVTESKMAIAMARLGGIGFVHQFLPIEKRVKEVELVKRADSAVIEDPLTVTPQTTLRQAKAIMQKYNVSGLLVVDKKDNNKLLGILSHRDYQFQENEDVEVRVLMCKTDLVTALPGTTLAEAKEIFAKSRIEKLPIVDKQGRLRGLITAKDLAEKAIKFPQAAKDEKGRLLAGAAVGVGKYTGRNKSRFVVRHILNEVGLLIKAGADVILVDTARGNSELLVKTVKAIKIKFGENLPIIAGNVDTAEGALRLIEAGTDCIKVGIGPGSACKTREGTGVGIPQLTAIAECSAVAETYGIPIMADGGIKTGSDLVKALIAGADTLMIGGLLAGTEETPGKPFYEDGEKWKIFRGSASLEFQLSRYDREEERGSYIRVPEGVPKRVKYRGEATFVAEELMGYLRSAMSYVGAWNLAELQQKGRFRWQTRAGYEEGKPHDVLV